jgi:hypothetical protein
MASVAQTVSRQVQSRGGYRGRYSSIEDEGTHES